MRRTLISIASWFSDFINKPGYRFKCVITDQAGASVTSDIARLGEDDSQPINTDKVGEALKSVYANISKTSHVLTGRIDGGQAKPCIAGIDGDGNMEIALTTMLSGLMVYDVN